MFDKSNEIAEKSSSFYILNYILRKTIDSLAMNNAVPDTEKTKLVFTSVKREAKAFKDTAKLQGR